MRLTFFFSWSKKIIISESRRLNQPPPVPPLFLPPLGKPPFPLSPDHPTKPREGVKKSEAEPIADPSPPPPPFLPPSSSKQITPPSQPLFDMQPSSGWDEPACRCSFKRNWEKLGIFALMTVEVSCWSRILLLSVGFLATSAAGKWGEREGWGLGEDRLRMSLCQGWGLPALPQGRSRHPWAFLFPTGMGGRGGSVGLSFMEESLSLGGLGWAGLASFVAFFFSRQDVKVCKNLVLEQQFSKAGLLWSRMRRRRRVGSSPFRCRLSHRSVTSPPPPPKRSVQLKIRVCARKPLVVVLPVSLHHHHSCQTPFDS